MTSLHNLVEMTTGDLSRWVAWGIREAQHLVFRWRTEVNARLDNLDLALGTRTRHDLDPDDMNYDDRERPAETLSGVTQFSDQKSHCAPGLLDRVSVLEALGALTPARTCSDLWRLGVTTSGLHWIDPDGPGAGRAPVRVHCDMRTGATRIGHNFAGELRHIRGRSLVTMPTCQARARCRPPSADRRGAACTA